MLKLGIVAKVLRISVFYTRHVRHILFFSCDDEKKERARERENERESYQMVWNTAEWLKIFILWNDSSDQLYHSLPEANL